MKETYEITQCLTYHRHLDRIQSQYCGKRPADPAKSTMDSSQYSSGKQKLVQVRDEAYSRWENVSLGKLERGCANKDNGQQWEVIFELQPMSRLRLNELLI